jgi:hypothetical protein
MFMGLMFLAMYVPHWALFDFLKEHGKTKAWLNILSSRYGLIPRPIIQSQMALPAGMFQLPTKGKKTQMPGRVFLYHRDVKELILDIIHEHDQNQVPYAQIAEKFRSRVTKIDNLMGYSNGDVATRTGFSHRVKSVDFFENFRTALQVGQKLGIFKKLPPSLTGLSMLADDALRLSAKYQEMMRKRKSNPANVSRAECEQLSGLLDYIHVLMDSTARFFFKASKKQKEAGLWFKTASEVKSRAQKAALKTITDADPLK